jgi:malonyl-CoA/methylmalonyl-CoA synthetase
MSGGLTGGPDRTAVVTGDDVWTCAELEAAASGAAASLLAQASASAGRDVTDLAEDRVAFAAEPRFDTIALLLGIWRAGGVAVPLAVSHPPAEREYVLADAGARLVPENELGGHFGRSAQNDLRAHLPSVNQQRRALILYTSGTTGRPKGVVSTHRNIEAQVASLLQAWEWTDRDRSLLVLPLNHVHGLINVVCCALAVGAPIEMPPKFDAETSWDRLASGDITVFTAVPTIYHRLIASWNAAPPDVRRARSDGCRRARLMMSGSAQLPISTLERWRAISGHTLLERYGMTEIGMALSNPLHGTRRPGCVGTPLPGVEVRLTDDAGAPVAQAHSGVTSAPGELEVRGPNVFLEYWKRPAETAAAFRDGWFRTGDLAVVSDGAYRLLGRTSVDIIKTGGYKVSALEIEDVVREHPSVADCAVVGVADHEWGERVAAAIELHPGEPLTLDALQAFVKPRLASYKLPRALRIVSSLPRTAMGKVVKAEVAKLFQN